MFSKKIIILIFILFSTLSIFVLVFLNDRFSASARRAAFEADRTRYMSDILRITNGVMPVLWISPQYSYRSLSKYFDLSGNGNHATQGTADYQPAVNPPGLEFDGSDDYVNAGSDSSVDDISVITIEAWIYPTGFGEDSAGRIINKGSKLLFTATDLTYIETISFYHSFSINNGQWYTPDYSINLNQWQHVAVVYNNSAAGNNPIIYIDGASQTLRERNIPDGVATSDAASSLIIGNRLALDRTFNGSIDSVRIYNIALTAAQIQNLYLAGLPGHR